MSPEDMQRFQIDPLSGGAFSTDGILITCTRCRWDVEVEAALGLTLAELVQRADEHTEVCR